MGKPRVIRLLDGRSIEITDEMVAAVRHRLELLKDDALAGECICLPYSKTGICLATEHPGWAGERGR